MSNTEAIQDTQAMQRAVQDFARKQSDDAEIRAYAVLAASIVLMVNHQGFAMTIDHLRNVADRIEHDIFLKEKEGVE